MKSKCCDDISYRSGDLIEKRYDLMEQPNVFYSIKRNLRMISKKINDPSEEVENNWDKVKECDPLNGLLHPKVKGGEINENEANQLCKLYSTGICKQGLSYTYYHPSSDCKDHTEN